MIARAPAAGPGLGETNVTGSIALEMAEGQTDLSLWRLGQRFLRCFKSTTIDHETPHVGAGGLNRAPVQRHSSKRAMHAFQHKLILSLSRKFNAAADLRLQ